MYFIQSNFRYLSATPYEDSRMLCFSIFSLMENGLMSYKKLIENQRYHLYDEKSSSEAKIYCHNAGEKPVTIYRPA